MKGVRKTLLEVLRRVRIPGSNQNDLKTCAVFVLAAKRQGSALAARQPGD